ncbi:hypothetical protein B0H14DRAFT_3895679, partial [Mycena olivaceomarginata]
RTRTKALTCLHLSSALSASLICSATRPASHTLYNVPLYCSRLRTLLHLSGRSCSRHIEHLLRSCNTSNCRSRHCYYSNTPGRHSLCSRCERSI